MNNENQNNSIGEQIRHLLWTAAGAVVPVLEKCPTEQTKYTAMGLLMIFIALLASVSFAFFLSANFGISFLSAIPFGFVWGGLVFCLDRVLLTSYRKGETSKISVAQRFLLTAAIAITIGEPFLMHLFESEINLEMTQKTQVVLKDARENAASRFKAETVSLVKADKEINTRLDSLKADRDAKEQVVITETEGKSVTGKAGFGIAAKQKEIAFKEADGKYKEYKTESADALKKNSERLAEIQTAITDETKQIAAANSQAKGVLARQKALFSIVRNDLGAAFVYIPLFMILLFLETLPLSLKVFRKKKSVYDTKLESVESGQIAEIEEADKFKKAELEHSRKLQNSITEKYREIILNGKTEGLTDENEIRTLTVMKTEALRAIEKAAFERQAEAFDCAEFGDEILVEVVGHDKFEFLCQVPKHARKSFTLETIGGDIGRIAEKVGKNLRLTKAFSSLKREISATLPLLPQLENDCKLLLLFEPVGKT